MKEKIYQDPEHKNHRQLLKNVHYNAIYSTGVYKPMGISGDTLREALCTSGNIRKHCRRKVELNGLLYVIERLPIGIEECRFINLTSDEGYSISFSSNYSQRKRNCYRIDEEQMNVEITRGRSDIYDILTHLTFILLNHIKYEIGFTGRCW
jgi:hypothetical protein